MAIKNSGWKRLCEIATNLGTTPEEYFISCGLDYKGQVQTGYNAHGWGGGANVSIDPGKIIVLNAEIGLEGSMKGAGQALVIAQRGPAKIPSLVNNGQATDSEFPIMLNCMTGKMWEGSIGANLSVGVKFEASTGVSTSGPSKSVEHTFKTSEDNNSSEIDGLGASFSAFAGAKAAASYKYHHYYGEDPLPTYYDAGDLKEQQGKMEIRKNLKGIFEQGDVHKSLRERAFSFMEQHPNHYRSFSRTNFKFERNTSTIYEHLLNETKKVSDSAISMEAKNILNLLRPWVEKSTYRQRGLNFVRISSHNPTASAGLSASVEAKAGASAVVGVSASAEIKGPTAAYTGKRAYIRHQSHTPSLKKEDPVLLWTQDTVMSYHQIDLNLLSASVGISGGSQLLGKQKEATVEKGKSWVWNGLSYSSSTIYWRKPADLEVKNNKQSRKSEGVEKVTALPGSGVSFGQSCIVKNLAGLYNNIMDDTTVDELESGTRRYLQKIADSLHVSLEDLLLFFKDNEVGRMIADLFNTDKAVEEVFPSVFNMRLRDFVNELNEKLANRTITKKQYDEQLAAAPKKIESEVRTDLKKMFGASGWQEKAILIESSFAAPSNVVVDVKRKAEYHAPFIGSNWEEQVVALDTGARDQLLKHREYKSEVSRRPLLQSIRLRYRIADMLDDDKERFSLGFKIAGTGAGIQLLEVSRAGSEGIVDLYTKWMDASLENLGNGVKGPKESYEHAVPPVTLFCQ